MSKDKHRSRGRRLAILRVLAGMSRDYAVLWMRGLIGGRKRPKNRDMERLIEEGSLKRGWSRGRAHITPRGEARLKRPERA